MSQKLMENTINGRILIFDQKLYDKGHYRIIGADENDNFSMAAEQKKEEAITNDVIPDKTTIDKHENIGEAEKMPGGKMKITGEMTIKEESTPETNQRSKANIIRNAVEGLDYQTLCDYAKSLGISFANGDDREKIIQLILNGT